MPLLILLCQQRRLITLQSDLAHLKLVAELYDSCQQTLLQYILFMQTALAPEEYARVLPGIEDLAGEYLVEPELIFQLVRPLLKAALPRCGALSVAPSSPIAAGEADESELEEGETNDPTEVAEPTESAVPSASVAFEELWTLFMPGIRSLMEAQWNFKALNWRMYTMFWALELSDLELPKERYGGDE